MPQSSSSHVPASSPAVTPIRRRPKFHFYTIDELAEAPPVPQLVQGILPAGSLGMVFGAPGCMKSYTAIDLGLSVASGTPWHGRKTIQGEVIYVAAERSSGLHPRIDAWRRARKAAVAPPFVIIQDPLHLLDSEEVDTLLAKIANEGRSPRLIILDTLARCFRGDENSVRDMGDAVEALDKIRAATGAAVLLIHHTRKSGDVERGSTALRGAVDAALLVRKQGNLVTIVSEKSNDLPAFDDIQLQAVPVGDSCVLQELTVAGAESSGDAPATPLAPELLQALTHLAAAAPISARKWGKDLGVARSTFDRRVEILLDRDLAQRGTSGCTLTDAGRKLLEQAQQRRAEQATPIAA